MRVLLEKDFGKMLLRHFRKKAKNQVTTDAVQCSFILLPCVTHK